jgi:hypothetical protein
VDKSAAFGTGGVLFGKLATLPNGPTEGGVTTDANSLNGSATRTTASVFIGLAHGFAATEAKARLLQPFSVARYSDGGSCERSTARKPLRRPVQEARNAGWSAGVRRSPPTLVRVGEVRRLRVRQTLKRPAGMRRSKKARV